MGATALGAARVRAEENRRADRLFDDPYAEAFVAAAPEVFPEEERAASSGALTSVGAVFRDQAPGKRFFDDYVFDACAACCRQVVPLGAGLDARAFLLAWPPGVRLFELDLTDVIAFKEAVLAQATDGRPLLTDDRAN